MGERSGAHRASALHQSSFRNLRLRFIYRSQMSQLTVTHPRPFREQHARLSRMIRGHCAYYGVSGNSKRLRWYHHQVVHIWRKWLARRGRHSKLSWSRFHAMLARHPLPSPLLVHRYDAT